MFRGPGSGVRGQCSRDGRRPQRRQSVVPLHQLRGPCRLPTLHRLELAEERLDVEHGRAVDRVQARTCRSRARTETRAQLLTPSRFRTGTFSPVPQHPHLRPVGIAPGVPRLAENDVRLVHEMGLEHHAEVRKRIETGHGIGFETISIKADDRFHAPNRHRQVPSDRRQRRLWAPRRSRGSKLVSSRACVSGPSKTVRRAHGPRRCLLHRGR